MSERDREILEFERQWFKFPAAKESAVLEKFDMTATRYYQVLGGLVDRPEALAYDALQVGRLRRIRGARRDQRSKQKLGASGADRVPSAS